MSNKPLSAVTPPAVEKKFASTLEWLVDRINSFLKMNKGLTEASFGWAAIKDTGLVERLRNGGDVTTRKLDALVRFMSNPHKKENPDVDQESKKALKKGK